MSMFLLLSTRTVFVAFPSTINSYSVLVSIFGFSPEKKTLPASISNVKFVEHTPPEVTETRQAKTKLIMNQINHEPE